MPQSTGGKYTAKQNKRKVWADSQMEREWGKKKDIWIALFRWSESDFFTRPFGSSERRCVIRNLKSILAEEKVTFLMLQIDFINYPSWRCLKFQVSV